MKIIKGVLEEELKKAVRMQEEYEKALKALPHGGLVKKFVKGYQYYYLMMREGGKVRFQYKGNLMSKEIKYYEEVERTGRGKTGLLFGAPLAGDKKIIDAVQKHGYTQRQRAIHLNMHYSTV